MSVWRSRSRFPFLQVSRHSMKSSWRMSCLMAWTTGSLQNWERPRTNGVLRSKYRLAQHQPVHKVLPLSKSFCEVSLHCSDLPKIFSAPPETLEHHRDLQCFVLPGSQAWTPKGRFWACQVNCGKLKSHSRTAALNAAFCSTPEQTVAGTSKRTVGAGIRDKTRRLPYWKTLLPTLGKRDCFQTES